MLLRKGKQIIGGPKIELPGRRFRRFPLQFVFGNDEVYLAGNKITECRIVRNLTLFNGSTIHNRAGTRSLLQRSDGRGVRPRTRSDIGVTAATRREEDERRDQAGECDSAAATVRGIHAVYIVSSWLTAFNPVKTLSTILQISFS
jgi:hypothetical protein